MGSLIKSVILEDGQFYSHWLSNHSPSSMFRTVFSLVLLFAVAYQHVEALECFHCGVPNSGQCGIPGGQKNLTCTGSARFCEVKFSNSRPILKSCSNATSIPKEYKAVAGDPEKRCKTSKGNQDKHCYCSESRCNDNDKAFNGVSSIHTFGLGMVGMLVLRRLMM